jgi:hypothetical protein
MPGLDEIGSSPSAGQQERNSMVRCHGLITHELNERIKAWARAQGRTADTVAGELLMKSAAQLDRWEAEETVKRLKERYGADWLSILQAVSTESGSSLPSN